MARAVYSRQFPSSFSVPKIKRSPLVPIPLTIKAVSRNSEL